MESQLSSRNETVFFDQKIATRNLWQLLIYIILLFYIILGGGNSNIFGIFTPILGEDSHVDEHIFQLGWFNHQLVFYNSCNKVRCPTLEQKCEILRLGKSSSAGSLAAVGLGNMMQNCVLANCYRFRDSSQHKDTKNMFDKIVSLKWHS